MHMALEITRIGLELAAAVTIFILAVHLDERKARWERVQYNMTLFVAKAASDRNAMVRIPAQLVNKAFDLGIPEADLPGDPKKAGRWRRAGS